MIKTIAFVLCFLVLISSCKSKACKAVKNECNCYKIYQPVCGCDDITYSNDCAANCAGVEIVSQGKCPD